MRRALKRELGVLARADNGSQTGHKERDSLSDDEVLSNEQIIALWQSVGDEEDLWHFGESIPSMKCTRDVQISTNIRLNNQAATGSAISAWSRHFLDLGKIKIG